MRILLVIKYFKFPILSTGDYENFYSHVDLSGSPRAFSHYVISCLVGFVEIKDLRESIIILL